MAGWVRALAIASLLAGLGVLVGAQRAQARQGGPADSLAAPLAAADLVLIGSVAKVEAHGASVVSRLLVEVPLKGPVPARVDVRSERTADGRRLPTRCYFEPGDRVLVMLKAQDHSHVCVEGRSNAAVVLGEHAEARAQARALVEGYLEVGPRPPGHDFLVAWARIQNAALRSGVRQDLHSQLTPSDGPQLLAWAADPSAPLDLRMWAVGQAARLAAAGPPAARLSLLDGSHPAPLREAVLASYAWGAEDADLPALRLALTAPEPSVRRTAVESFLIPGAVPVLLAHFEEEDERAVRLALIRALGAIDAQVGAPALETILGLSLAEDERTAARLALAAARERTVRPEAYQ